MIRLMAIPAYANRDMVCSVVNLGGPPDPEHYAEISKAAEIPELIERFGAAVHALFPDASFAVSCWHAQRIDGRSMGKKKPGFDAANSSAARQKHAHVTATSLPTGKGGAMWDQAQSLEGEETALTGEDLVMACGIMVKLDEARAAYAVKYPGRRAA